jgi:aminoglycoside/choline kinase family phosphotransferase
LITRFLDSTDWADAERLTIAGDASNRRYERLSLPDGSTAILMDAPPEKGEDTRPFTRVTAYLRGVGLSAPQIYAQDTSHGFLLLEDLGDDLFARVMAADPSLERPLYAVATDALIALHAADTPDLVRYDADVMTNMAALAYDWYQRGALGDTDQDAKDRFKAAFHATLTPLNAQLDVLIQRDYHAENLIWLPSREGVARVGLLDYQDATIGHRAYDLVSVLQDARRDVSPEIADNMITRYTQATGVPHEKFKADFAVLGTQRNLRILGVFARLSLAYGKAHYVDLIPRVWNHIQTNLKHPALQSVAPLIHAALPAPTPKILQRLKDKCATIPLP